MNGTNTELLELLGAVCNETVTPDQADRLHGLLSASSDARELYCDYLDAHVMMLNHASRGNGSCSEIDDSPLTLSRDDLMGGCELPATDSLESRGKMAFPFGLTVALAASIAIGVTTYWYTTSRAPTGSETVAQSPTSDASDQAGVVDEQRPAVRSVRYDTAQPLYVARVTDLSSDVVWGDTTDRQDFLFRVRRGDRIDLLEGFVRVDFYSGASITLDGPCVFVATDESAGRLERGQLTGKVADGEFLLTTPTATVLDLGTEFGVSVDDDAETEVCVFDGAVRVGAGQGYDDPSGTLLLRKGMAARVMQGGQLEKVLDVDANRFNRSSYLAPPFESDPMEISLVDILSGGNGSEWKLAGVIGPDTGDSDRQPWLRDDGPGYRLSNGFQPTAWHPFVEGVFIPSKRAGKNQIDSAGTVVQLPKTSGRTWGPIWSRRNIKWADSVRSHEDYWGTDTLDGVVSRLELCETGMIGIHSNVGVTFDLDALRCHHSKSLVELRGTVSNLDNSSERMPKYSASRRLRADLRIYVDGELRASRLDFGRVDGELEMRTSLSDRDHRLTLVSTDAAKVFHDGHDAFDHVVLIDPVLQLAE